MELREPPRPPTRAAHDTLVRALLIANLAALIGLAVWLGLRWRATGADAAGSGAEVARQVAAKLKAAGALGEADALYERYLASAELPAPSRARIAYSLGTSYLDQGRYERALRWFYEAETLGAGDLAGELGEKIVHALEGLGRVNAAQAAVASRVRLDDGQQGTAKHPEGDPVVATIGGQEIHRSEVLAALDDLPAELSRQFAQRPQDFLRKYVADELLWRKAVKMELDDDPEVRRTVANLTKQVAVSKLLEREVMDRIRVDDADLANYFAAHQERYQRPGKDGAKPTVPELSEVRQQVERDYRMEKAQAGYQQMIDSQLAAADVKLFPERMRDGK
jgi:tetratricopeptide (TPR) repeat protein